MYPNHPNTPDQLLPTAFRINMLEFMETGTYEDVYQRPYTSHLNHTSMAAFQETTLGGQNINVNTVAGVAGDILRPAAEIEFNPDGTPKQTVELPYGFGARRFMFVMEVVFPGGGFHSGSGLRQLVYGFTDHLGATVMSGLKTHIDPNMRLYINGVTTIRSTEVNGPTGTYIEETVAEDSQILTGRFDLSGGGFGGAMQPDLNSRTLRPQDIFHNTQIGMYRDVTTHDARTNFAQGLKKSRRVNNVAPDYLSRVAKAWQLAQQQGQEMENEQVISGRASGIVADPHMGKDRFLRVLNDAANFHRTGFVTYGELCRMQPDLDNIANTRFQDRTSLRQTHSRGQGEYWHSAGPEPVMAMMLLQATPAIMIPLMLARVKLFITNRTHGMEYQIRPIELWGFQRMPINEQRFMLFAERLKTEVLRDLTQNNLIDLALELTIDVLGESEVKISIQGKPFVNYAVPSFCDGRFAPTLTQQSTVLENLAHDMAQLCQGTAIQMGGPANGPRAMQPGAYPAISVPVNAGYQPPVNPDAPPGYGSSPIIVPGQTSTNFMNKV